MSDCTDVCEVVMETLLAKSGFDIKTGDEDTDHDDVIEAFCKYSHNYAKLLDACKMARDVLNPNEDKDAAFQACFEAVVNAE